jgi:hypothetical protein
MKHYSLSRLTFYIPTTSENKCIFRAQRMGQGACARNHECKCCQKVAHRCSSEPGLLLLLWRQQTPTSAYLLLMLPLLEKHVLISSPRLSWWLAGGSMLLNINSARRFDAASKQLMRSLGAARRSRRQSHIRFKTAQEHLAGRSKIQNSNEIHCTVGGFIAWK